MGLFSGITEDPERVKSLSSVVQMDKEQKKGHSAHSQNT